MMSRIDWVRLDVTDSTNNYAKQHACAHNTAVLAAVQTQGKGRDGRAFLSQKGGMYLSLVRRDFRPLAQCAAYMLAAPLAVCDVLAEYGIEADIKWPNDVWVQGKKIAGVLVETEWRDGLVSCAVVGIGLNVSNDIADVPCRATSMLAEGVKADVFVVANSVAERFFDYVEQPLSALTAGVKKWLITLGKRVVLPDGRTAVAVDLAEDGRLIVEVTGERVAVAAGDVNLQE